MDNQPPPPYAQWGPTFSWFGFILVTIGLLWLLGKMGYLRVNPDYLAPLALIAVGILLMASRAKRRKRW